MNELHRDCYVIDGLIVSNWGRPVFEAMHRGGITAANCTCSIWEGFDSSMRAIAQWKMWFAEHADLIMQAYTARDIETAKTNGKVAIVLGWQNSSGFDEYLPFVQVFRELGLRVVQLTYHSANMAGSGCLESSDGGLTDFGRDLIEELNRNRILIDLSHVGSITAEATIRASRQPVAYTHCAPKALKDHPRNKSDEDLRLIAEHGGFVGVTMFPPFMPLGNESTIDDYLTAIEHTISICGEAQVGIGTDFTQDVSPEGMQYFVHDKGYGRRLMPLGEVKNPSGFGRIEEYPNLTRAMVARGWKEARIRSVLGENWLRMLSETWGE